MKLLYTLTSYPPAVGGAQTHQHFLAQQMQKSHDVDVISQWDHNRADWLLGTTLNAPQHKKAYTVDGISVERIGISLHEKLQMSPFVPTYYPLMGLSLPTISNILAKHLTAKASEASLIHNVRIGREGLSFASLQTARQYKIPFILTPVHHPRWVGWRYKQFLNLYRQADGLFALTQSEKKILIDLGVKSERIHVIGHGPVVASTQDSQSFRLKHKIADPIVLFLGQHYEYKGYRCLLDATKLVWQKHPDTHFVFVGPSVRDSNKAFDLYKDSRIHRLGKVSFQEKTDALAACTLLCVPSSQESFGGVYTEAWMFEKPVIGYDIPAIAEVIDDEVNGFLVQQQPKMIAQRILDLLDDPAAARAMGESGKEKVAQNYTWPAIAQKATAAYNKTIAGSATH